MALVSGGFSGNIPTFDRRATSGVFDLDEQKYLREQGLWGQYPWDIERARYFGKKFTVSAQEATPTSCFISPDGAKLYVIGTTGDDINQYTLQTPGDVSTAVFDGVTMPVGQADTAPQVMHFSPDGRRLYVNGSAVDLIFYYFLNTPWDLSTAVYTNSSPAGLLEANLRALYVRADGLRAYTAGNNGSVFQYTFGTAWQANTITYNPPGYALNSAPGFATANGLTFRPDGATMYACDIANDRVFEYSLATPWEIVTASYTGRSFDFVNAKPEAGQNPGGIGFSSDGLNLYVLSTNDDTIYQFEMF